MPAIAAATSPFVDLRRPFRLPTERFEVYKFVLDAVVAKKLVVVAFPCTRRLPVVVAPPAMVSPPA